jgi:hypothetical protein
MYTSTYYPSRRTAIGGIMGGLFGFPSTWIPQTSAQEVTQPVKTMTLSEQILHSTVQIICETTAENKSFGTGFFFGLFQGIKTYR